MNLPVGPVNLFAAIRAKAAETANAYVEGDAANNARGSTIDSVRAGLTRAFDAWDRGQVAGEELSQLMEIAEETGLLDEIEAFLAATYGRVG